jgi:hypothetical protein
VTGGTGEVRDLDGRYYMLLRAADGHCHGGMRVRSYTVQGTWLEVVFNEQILK